MNAVPSWCSVVLSCAAALLFALFYATSYLDTRYATGLKPFGADASYCPLVASDGLAIAGAPFPHLICCIARSSAL